jgi:acetoin utilization deacetylase AcuC-like enzyme
MAPRLPSIPVFFRTEMVADGASFSPSAGKPAQAVADWKSCDLPVDVRSFDPVDEATLALAHDPTYVRGVLSCEIVNGFGNRRRDVAASLPYTSGAMLAAAREAIANGRVACAPVSGFHHACHGHAEGYCTFNGLMVTAFALRRAGLAERVGILDLDHHWGNGTEDIIGQHDARWVQHHSSGKLNPGAEDAKPYLGRLATLVSTFLDCDVLLYQAGADAHVDDDLGGWMTSEQLARRDRIVFESAAKIGVPVAWNLAGGYQRDEHGGIEPVLAIHRATMQACVAVYCGERRGRM